MAMFSQKRVIIYLLIVFICGLVIGYFSSYSWNLGLAWQGLPFHVFGQQLFKKQINYSLFDQVWTLIHHRYVKQPISEEKLFYGTLSGMVAGLDDPYSAFLDPEIAKDFKREMSGSFEGIGIEIAIKNKRLTIIAPLPDTPAARAGLRPGDNIEAIDGLDSRGLTLDQAARLIRGKKGTSVVLTISREGWLQPKEIEIIRDKIDIKTVNWQMKNGQIAYIRITHFNENTYQDFSQVVKEILSQKPKGLILDLRNNPGGYLDVAVDIAGFWLDNQVVTVSLDAQKKTQEFRSQGNAEFKDLPTVVLINQGSASASEILAGALQDYQLATLLGEKTFGKGSVQELIDLLDGSALKLTTAYWLTPYGRMIDEKGIAPDVEVELTDEDYNANRDPQLDKALELLQK